MILNNAPQNEAIVSNVGEIGEFRIRNSAKAFNILSSGLYANKIRAIIRELSCNAIDSHVAAGRIETPFDVHLPNQLEPWFAIRDYGTGLSHEQVTNIYTTYFESTKTNSNDFIGALGLGSKSPFSYTDNFTVTAIKDGVKGIYTAFINDQGVPSIALMMQEPSDDLSGVEVKFSVNDRYDFSKFRDEAATVYKWFKQRPVVRGSSNFEFSDVDYIDKDIIPGVHTARHGNASMAVMGNIAYPIDIPNAEQTLGELRGLLKCGLVMEFDIGELDFQASREGLSYIPQTVESIKTKLEALNAILSVRVAEEAGKIENLWERALFLSEKKGHDLWAGAVGKYATDTNLPTYNANQYNPLKEFNLATSALAKKYNIVIRGFQRTKGTKTAATLKTNTRYANNRAKNKHGHYITWDQWTIRVEKESHFVINDLKTGAFERAKYHYRETATNVYSRNVYVLDAVDRSKPMLLDLFFAKIYNPPKDRQFLASSLIQKERVKGGMGADVTIMRLEERGGAGYHRSKEMVWRDAGQFSDFDSTKTYYYVPVSGFKMQSSKGYSSGKELFDDARCIPNFSNFTIYGVRKADLETIKLQKNWINFEDYIGSVLSKQAEKILLGLVKSSIDVEDMFRYNTNSILEKIAPNSPYKLFASEFDKVEAVNRDRYQIERMYKRFVPNVNLDPSALIAKYQGEADNVKRRYPLLNKLSTYRIDAGDIAEYINLIDASKGI